MLELDVAGMTCAHCVRAVEAAVGGVPGVVAVSVDLPAGHVTVSGEPDPQAVRRAISEEGYTVR